MFYEYITHYALNSAPRSHFPASSAVLWLVFLRQQPLVFQSELVEADFEVLDCFEAIAAL
jgi:hypothetical protein